MPRLLGPAAPLASSLAASLAASLLAALALATLATACRARAPDEPDFGPAPTGAAAAERPVAADAINPRLLRRFRPLRESFDAPEDPPPIARIALGRMLWFDERLSKSGDISCDSCHTLADYGVDHSNVSTGFRGRRGTRNAPSVYHAAGAFTCFWDGRAATVEEQVRGPLFSAKEMAMPSPQILVDTLRAIPGYAPLFASAFPGEAAPITYDNIAAALGAFERGLVTPSRWDRYLRGERDALTSMERRGLKLFTSLGCITCHTGELVGASSFQKVGVLEPWPNQKDLGRYEITKLDADRMSFRVPSLRNVAMTAPYFHDGSVHDLAAAVTMMGRYQLGETIAPGDVAAIVAWLSALTGELPRSYIAEPELPASAPPRPSVATRD